MDCKKILNINKIKIFFFINKKLFPKDFNLKKFNYITQNFKVDKKIICMPDLNFKAKNFIPTGVNIPIINSINPILLSSNINDSIGSLKLKNNKNLDKRAIKKIFITLKKRIKIFRSTKNQISVPSFKSYLKYGVKNIYLKWGFLKKEIERIESNGSEKLDMNIEKILKNIKKKKIESLPSYVPRDGILNRGMRNIGVLDGTSHFIELFRVNKILKKKDCKYLNVELGDYFFLVHAGSGDVGRYFHHHFLDKKINNIDPKTTKGKLVKNSYLAAINYGFVNRLYIYKNIKETIFKVLKTQEIEIFSDLPHDYLEIEKKTKTIFHRKGVVRLKSKKEFKKNNSWFKTGTPYVLPSNPSGDAYLMIGRNGSKESLYSLNHGMGRTLSKKEAEKKIKSFKFNKETMHYQMFRYKKDKINTQSPEAFKDTNSILKIIKKNKLADNIAILKSVASLKA